jgi:signal transduction histidine kinase
MHTETDERRLDDTPMRIEGDYMVIYDDRGRIAGHFGIQRDITDRHLAAERIGASQRELRALAVRLQQVREEERTSIAREIHASSAFRILQEALTNVARHAHARRVIIRLQRTPAYLQLEVVDDGIGISDAQLDGTASLGLVGMRERALACGGELAISGRPGGGTAVLLRAPVGAEHAA